MSIVPTEIKERYFIFHSIPKILELNNREAIDELPEEKHHALRIFKAIQRTPPAIADVIVALNPSKPIETIAVATLVVNELIRDLPELIADKPPYSIHPTVRSEIWKSLLDLLSHKSPTVRLRALSALEVLATAPNPFTPLNMLSMMGRFCTNKRIRKALIKEKDERVKQKMSNVLSTIEAVRD